MQPETAQRGCAHTAGQHCRVQAAGTQTNTAKMTRAALPAQVAHANSTLTFCELLRLQLAQIQLYATTLVRLIMKGVFKD